MLEKPYYEQPYVQEKDPIPEANFAQILKALFFAPFKWDARSTRREFWIAYAIQWGMGIIFGSMTIINLLLMIIVSAIPALLVIVISFEVIWVGVAVWVTLGNLGYTVRRLHDSNHSGWWYLLAFIPFGFIFVLYLLVLPSVEKPVKWGTYLFINED